MGVRIISTCFVFVIVSCFGVDTADGIEQFDPLEQITKTLPGSIQVDEKRMVIEFCPDNTCDGFVATRGVSLETLKDFSYLYLQFFSDFYVLQEWRNRKESLTVAERVLSKADYRECRPKDDQTMALCVLTSLSRGGRISLLSIRYDEKRRIVKRKVTVQGVANFGSSDATT